MGHTLEAPDPPLGDSNQRVLDVAARLEGASVGVNIDVSHGPLDADAAVRGAPGVGVQDVHELGIVPGQGALVVSVLEGGTGRIQTCVEEGKRFHLLWPHYRKRTRMRTQKQKDHIYS